MDGDLRDRRRLEEALAAVQRDLAVHDAIAEVFLTVPDDEVYERVLEVLLTTFESGNGIFGYLDDDGSLVVPPRVAELTTDRVDDDPRYRFPCSVWDGPWGEALTRRRSVRSNRSDIALPDGTPVTRCVAAPILYRGALVGVLAVADRDRDYTAKEHRELDRIASHIGAILNARQTRDRLGRERDSFLRALEVSERRYRAIVQQQSDFVARFLPDGTLTFVNDALCGYTGSSRSQLIGRSLWGFLSDEARRSTTDHVSNLTPDNPTGVNEISWVNPDGETRYLSFINHALFDGDGHVIEYQSVGRDVTEHRVYREKLENALAEKEVLLKEIHHRVKNNMAVISSFLSLHERSLQSPEALEVFASMRRRIKAMSLVHEQIYRSGDFANIELGGYVAKLARTLAQSQTDNVDRIRVENRIRKVTLDLEQAIPCGLIVTELLSNALKHGFPEPRTGTVRVVLRKLGPDEVELVVEDDGVGRTVEDPQGFGLHMVDLLVRQLGGSVRRSTQQGYRVEVRFPIAGG